jgi:hypothetical protein
MTTWNQNRVTDRIYRALCVATCNLPIIQRTRGAVNELLAIGPDNYVMTHPRRSQWEEVLRDFTRASLALDDGTLTGDRTGEPPLSDGECAEILRRLIEFAFEWVVEVDRHGGRSGAPMN